MAAWIEWFKQPGFCVPVPRLINPSLNYSYPLENPLKAGIVGFDASQLGCLIRAMQAAMELLRR